MTPADDGAMLRADHPHSAALNPHDSVRIPADTAELQFVRLLGHGGMGAVFEAREVASGRRVAVKLVLRLHPSTDELRRFERETLAAAGVFHPNSVCVFGVTRIEDKPAIIMEYVDGGDLESHLSRCGEVSPDQCIEWAVQILDALTAAHDRGIVHRDVKPSNIFLTRDGRLKLGDYGLARSIETAHGLTATGMFVGTPQFASPEQARGEPATRHSDIFSVGCVLYRVLAGRAPFQGHNFLVLLEKIRTETEQPLHIVRKGVPRELSKALARAMAKDPADRYENAREFRDALASLSSKTIRASDQGRRLGAWFVDQLIMGVPMLIGSALWFRSGIGFGEAAAVAALRASYYGLFEYFRQATPGKSLFRLRVVETNGEPAPLWRCLLRASVFCAIFMIPLLPPLRDASNDHQFRLTCALTFPLAPLLLFVSARARNGLRGLHEIISGTCVRRKARVATPFVVLDLDRSPDQAPDSVPPQSRVVARSVRGILSEDYDPELKRAILVFVPNESSPPPVLSDTGLRRLKSRERGIVFEHPGGSLLASIPRAGLGWSAVHRILTELAQQLRAAPRAVPCGQIWIDDAFRPIILDFLREPARTSTEADGRVTLTQVARFLVREGDRRKPFDMPISAERVVDRLLENQAWPLEQSCADLEKMAAGTGDRMGARDRWAPILLLVSLWFWIFETVRSVAPREPFVVAQTLMLVSLIPSALFALRTKTLASYWMCGIGLRNLTNARAPTGVFGGATANSVFNIVCSSAMAFASRSAAPVLMVAFCGLTLICVAGTPKDRLGDCVLGRRAFIHLSLIFVYTGTVTSLVIGPMTAAGNQLRFGATTQVIMLALLLCSALLAHAAALARPERGFHRALGVQAAPL